MRQKVFLNEVSLERHTHTNTHRQSESENKSKNKSMSAIHAAATQAFFTHSQGRTGTRESLDLNAVA